MIKLLVEDYCHECPEFYPEKTGGEAYYAGDNLMHLTDCIITCNEYERCQRIKKHLEKNRDT